MKKVSFVKLAAIAIAALLISLLALPVFAESAAPAAGSGAGARVTASKSGPYAAYHRRTRRHRRHVHRRRRYVRRVTPVATPIAPLATPTVAAPLATAPVDETTLARTILAGLQARYPRFLSGTTVEFGDALGYQAVSYYTIGRIVISPTHSASLTRILDHEIWHVIDYRDNGVIDWGESVPPVNMAEYAN